MEIRAVVGDVGEQETPAIAVGLYEGTGIPLTGTVGELDTALNGELGSIIADGDFKGKTNETLVLYTHGQLPAKRIILVGLGKPEEITLNAIREASATTAQKARSLGLSALHTIVLGGDAEDMSRVPDTSAAAEAVTEGALLGLYRFNELKTQDENHQADPEQLVVVISEQDDLAAMQEALRRGQIVAESTMLARDLVNRPANIASPSYLAQVAQEIATETGAVCKIIDKPTLEDLGMHLFLSVNRGGNEPARLIVLEHNPGVPDLPTVVLVGKGITFDTGGISLKPSRGMEKMKGDMGGAAAVLGALRAVALLNLPMHVVVLAPVTDNMPDAQATKPGDVVKSLNGLSVEIINTDAEGRLILADALTYAGEFQPDAVFDIATLTGGRVVALGDHAAAVMGDQGLIDRLVAAGEAAKERVWPMPLFKEYGKQLESDVADLKNVGGRAASSITAAYFLSKFVPDGIKWAHIDIAGLGIRDKADPYVPQGATGFGVRLFVEALRRWNA